MGQWDVSFDQNKLTILNMNIIFLVEFDQEILHNRQTKQTWFEEKIL